MENERDDMPVSEHCTCTPPGNPSVIGACACPEHGMKALRAQVERLRDEQRQLTSGYGIMLAKRREAEAEVERLTTINAEDRAARKAEVERLNMAYNTPLTFARERDEALAEVERLREENAELQRVNREWLDAQRTRGAVPYRYLIIGAPGWPGGIEPHPNTLENARLFVAEHGGTLRRRLQSEWEDVRDDG